MRCPICGGVGFKDGARWLCRCVGLVLAFWRSSCRWETEMAFEDFRQKRIREGFGWSWFTPYFSPIIVLGED